MEGDPLVHALVASANQDDPRLEGDFPGQPVVEPPARGRQEIDKRLLRTPDRFDRGEDRLGLEDHAFFAAERAVIHLLVLVRREIAKVMHPQVQPSPLDGLADDAPRKDAREHLGEDRDYIKSHLSPKGRQEDR